SLHDALPILARAQRSAADGLALAAASDAATAGSLRPLGPEVAPASGTDPGCVAGWWYRLPPAERQALIADRPDLIGNLDGVPADARDAANRARLTRLLDDPATPHHAALAAIRSRLD